MATKSADNAPRPARGWPRAVLHVDMDAFYASVEQRDHPELAGKAVIVGGAGRRGVVTSPSYEARKFGVKSAMPTFMALRLCPHAVVVPPRMSHYVNASRHIMAIFQRFSPVVEPLSLDEAFLDITGTEELFGPPVDVGWQVQKAVRDELSLSCSVGVAASKFIAKVASDLKKPGGLVVVPPGEERAFLEPLPVERLWGVGPKAAERLHQLGLVTIADVYAAGESKLSAELGALGTHIFHLSAGKDDRPVEEDRGRKSMGAERTLERDVSGKAQIHKLLLPLVDEIAQQLRKEKLRAGGVRLKLKYADFRRASRETTLPEPVQDSGSLTHALDGLLDKIDTDRPVRLVGLACTHLVDEAAPRQPSLFGSAPEAGDTAAPAASGDRGEALGRAVDKIEEKFGKGAIVRGSVGDQVREQRDRERGR